MNIAIYDNDSSMVGFLEEVVYECFKSNDSSFSCDGFLSGEELLTYFGHSQEKYQLYILGIHKDQEADLTLAARIGEVDPYAVIIIIGDRERITEEMIPVPVFRCLFRPLEKKRMKDVLLQAQAHVNLRRQTYVVKTGDTEREVPFLDIHYFTCGMWKTYMHTKAGKVRISDGKEKVLSHVAGNGFAEINHSYIINMEYIKNVENGNIIMNDQKQIKLAKKHQLGFNRAYREFAAARIW